MGSDRAGQNWVGRKRNRGKPPDKTGPLIAESSAAGNIHPEE